MIPKHDLHRENIMKYVNFLKLLIAIMTLPPIHSAAFHYQHMGPNPYLGTEQTLESVIGGAILRTVVGDKEYVTVIEPVVMRTIFRQMPTYAFLPASIGPFYQPMGQNLCLPRQPSNRQDLQSTDQTAAEPATKQTQPNITSVAEETTQTVSKPHQPATELTAKPIVQSVSQKAPPSASHLTDPPTTSPVAQSTIKPDIKCATRQALEPTASPIRQSSNRARQTFSLEKMEKSFTAPSRAVFQIPVAELNELKKNKLFNEEFEQQLLDTKSTLRPIGKSRNKPLSRQSSGSRGVKKRANKKSTSKHLPKKDQLYSYIFEFFDASELLARLQTIPDGMLTKLTLHGESVTDELLLALEPYIANTNLKYFDCSFCPRITDKGLVPLTKHFEQLQYLNLNSCPQITDKVLIGLSAAIAHSRESSEKSYVSKMRYLELEDCDNITDFGLIQLAPFTSELRGLNLSGCRHITDNSLLVLSHVLTRINNIFITGCDLITDKGERTLKSYIKRSAKPDSTFIEEPDEKEIDCWGDYLDD